MAISTAQPAIAQPSAAPTAEPVFLLSGSAADALRQLADRFPRLLSAAVLAGLPAKLPATRGYDFRNPRLLSEVLARLLGDLKLPALAQVDQQWSKLRSLPHAAAMTTEQWSEVLGGRAQLASPARFARHGRPVEGWDSPWLADERAPYWGPAKCWLCAVHAGVGGIFYFPHDEPCAPQCSGADGRCGSPLCNGCCIGCVRGRADCWGSCGAGGPCEVYADVQLDGEPLSGGPCVEGEGEQDEQPDNEDDRQDAPAEHALIKPPAQPTKPKPKPTAQAAPSSELSPAAPAALPVAPSLPKVLTDDAKRLAAPLIQSPTVKPVRSTVRKPLDVGAALASLLRK